MIFGATTVLGVALFGVAMDEIGGSFTDGLRNVAILLLYMGGVTWIFAWLQTSAWMIVATNVAYKTRIAYFAKCLERDAAFYDENIPSEMPSKIAKECSAIEQGCG